MPQNPEKARIFSPTSETQFRAAVTGAGRILDLLGFNHPHNQTAGQEHLVIFTNGAVTDPLVPLAFHNAAAGRVIPENIHLINSGDPNESRGNDGYTAQERIALTQIRQLVYTKSVDVVIKLADHSPASDEFYNIIYDKDCRARCAEVPGLTADSLQSDGIFANLYKIKSRQLEATRLLQEARSISIKGTNGTDLMLEFNPQERVYFDPPEEELNKKIPEGQKGRGANFPNGEVWRNPLPQSVNGTIVLDNIDTSIPIFRNFSYLEEIDWRNENPSQQTPNNGTVDEPICIKVVNGRISSIAGGYAAKSLAYYLDQEYKKALKRGDPDPEAVYYFGTEIGIGANHLVSRYQHDNKVTVVEAEKQLAFHIALGSSQTEDPYEHPDSLEYVRSNVHLDFIVPGNYTVEIKPDQESSYVFFGPAGSLDRYREERIYGVSDIVDERLTGLMRGSNPKEWGTFRKLKVTIPQEFLYLVDNETQKVIETAQKINLTVFDSGKPGDLVVVTSRMHGEEAKYNVTAADTIVTNLRRDLDSLVKGTIMVVDNLNPNGTQDENNLMRAAFPDESLTNLNNEFHRYQTGNWSEFFALPSKTAKLAWLIMKYLHTKIDEHKRLYGHESRTYFIDDHREEGTMMRVDRWDEDRERIERVYNAFFKVGLPILLESPRWREDELDQSLSANLKDAVTSESGFTRKVDIQGQYTALQVIKFFEELGLVKMKDEWHRDVDIYYSKILPEGERLITPLQKAVAFWKHQIETGEVYSMDEVIPQIRLNHDEKQMTIAALIPIALGKEYWDGIFTIDYNFEFLGEAINEGQALKIGDIAIGKFESTAILPQLPNESVIGKLFLAANKGKTWVVSRPEPKVTGNNFCLFGFFPDGKGGRKIVLEQIGDDYEGSVYSEENILTPQEIRKRIHQGYEVDLDTLGMQCAVPDPIWKGIKMPDGSVKFERRQ